MKFFSDCTASSSFPNASRGEDDESWPSYLGNPVQDISEDVWNSEVLHLCTLGSYNRCLSFVFLLFFLFNCRAKPSTISLSCLSDKYAL